ncbi:MAG: hypothetical protein MK108_09320 [Mariniblastus sp.]|nr:hypothetical protein [Mariniblastus sp.]
MNQLLTSLCGLLLIATLVQSGDAQENSPTKQDKPATVEFSVADGNMKMKAPSAWKKIKPKINFIEAEFQIPPTEGDENNGRLTIMGAGGSVQANIDRWIGQFKQSDGTSTRSKTKSEKMEVNGMPVHMVDITGNYMDGMGGPFGPKTERENYRMLGAIIETANDGRYFVKLYGPRKTIDKQAAQFKKMIQGVKVVD